MTTVYKVVRNVGGWLSSVYALGDYRTIYTPGERVTRANLFIFLDKHRARDSRVDLYEEEVWECSTESAPRVCPEFVPDYEHTRHWSYAGIAPAHAVKLIRDFWDAPYGWKEGPLEILARTTGAYLVDDVTLIRRLDE